MSVRVAQQKYLFALRKLDAQLVKTNAPVAHRKVSIGECCAEVLLARCARNNCPHIRRVRGRLTFMRGQSANAD